MTTNDRADANEGDCDSYRADRDRAPAALSPFYFNLVNSINKVPDRTRWSHCDPPCLDASVTGCRIRMMEVREARRTQVSHDASEVTASSHNDC